MTLHGSDLLVRADYLDCKLRHCRFCITISEFNRNYICQHYPSIDPGKILVHRLGVDVNFWRPVPRSANHLFFSILSVGRLHPIKNHEFLIRACHELKGAGLNFRCTIAGEGDERERLQNLIRKLRLGNDVTLCGHVRREQLPLLYSRADVVVLTSRCEGIPQTLMEAMAMERTVLAPEITGIPELIASERTGFLYEANSMPDFVVKLAHIAAASLSLDELRHEARRQVDTNFNHHWNLRSWAHDFLRHIDARTDNEELLYANPVLQQVQLPVQRDRSIPV
jgi:glycosyltransferase involved in cell wall biosynthesis